MLQCVGEGHEIVALANLRPKDKGAEIKKMKLSMAEHTIFLQF